MKRGQDIRPLLYDFDHSAHRGQAAGDVVDRLSIRRHCVGAGLSGRNGALLSRKDSDPDLQGLRLLHAGHARNGAATGGLLRYSHLPARHKRESGHGLLRQRHSRRRVRGVRAVAQQRRVHVRDDSRRNAGGQCRAARSLLQRESYDLAGFAQDYTAPGIHQCAARAGQFLHITAQGNQPGVLHLRDRYDGAGEDHRFPLLSLF